MTTTQHDPRKPVRPDGDVGANWAICRECGREAHKLKHIRHTKNCPWRR